MAEKLDKKHSKGAGIHKTRLDYSDPMVLLEIEGLARDGYDDCQIAEILDVAPQTFSRQKRKNKQDGSASDLSEALTKGRRPLSVLVENALYKRAVGQTVKTKSIVTKKVVIPGMNNDQPVEVLQETETHTELPGDVNAQLQWLKVHKPEMYNVQPERIDFTSKGKQLKEPPRIMKIEHVNINSDQVKKQENDDL